MKITKEVNLMLKIKDNVDLKRLEVYKIYPHYIVNEYTGETHIDYYETTRWSFKGLRIAKKRYRFTEGNFIDEKAFGELDCDLIYDLTKADLVEKIESK